MQRSVMSKVFVRLALFAACTFSGAAESRQWPNVLLIVSDNQPLDTIHALGNAYIETPHLDRLVSEGSVFTRAICANPHCVPSRAEILTGATGFVNRSSPFGGKLNLDLALWPAVMRQAGYRTWHSGKWNVEATPRQCGYEETRGMLSSGGGGGILHTVPTMNNGRPASGYRGYTFKTDDGTPEPEKGVGLTTRTDEYIADAAIDLIRRRSDKPFFLHVNFTASHDPLLVAPGDEHRYDSAAIPLPPNFLPAPAFEYGNAEGRDEQMLIPPPRRPEEIKRELADVYAVISRLDDQIGRVMAALRVTGQEKNTIVIFTTDNGMSVGRHGIRGYQNMYEHSMGVPLILAGPGVPRNQRFAAQTYLRDLFPTVCALVGIAIPATVEGKSLVPVLSGLVREIYPEVYGYWHRPGLTSDFPLQRMVRTERWKLIYYSHLNRHQLFDLQDDPYELRDLSGSVEHAEIRNGLQRKLNDWFMPRIERFRNTTAAKKPPP